MNPWREDSTPEAIRIASNARDVAWRTRRTVTLVLWLTAGAVAVHTYVCHLHLAELRTSVAELQSRIDRLERSRSSRTQFIDGSNASGCADDSNTCDSPICTGPGVGPCATWGEVSKRMGGHATIKTSVSPEIVAVSLGGSL